MDKQEVREFLEGEVELFTRGDASLSNEESVTEDKLYALDGRVVDYDIMWVIEDALGVSLEQQMEFGLGDVRLAGDGDFMEIISSGRWGSDLLLWTSGDWFEDSLLRDLEQSGISVDYSEEPPFTRGRFIDYYKAEQNFLEWVFSEWDFNISVGRRNRLKVEAEGFDFFAGVIDKQLTEQEVDRFIEEYEAYYGEITI